MRARRWEDWPRGHGASHDAASALLRANGFAVTPEQTTAFLSAIALLGPRDPEDIRRAGLATLAPPPERHAVYHLLFNAHFLGAGAGLRR